MTLRQRQPRVEEPAYLAWVRLQPCLICRRPGSDPAHIRTGSRQYGKRQCGMGEKPDDRWVLPLCRYHHTEQHSRNELAWWASYGIDPHATAVALYASWPGANRARPERRKIVKTPARKPKADRKAIPHRDTDWPKRELRSRNDLRKATP